MDKKEFSEDKLSALYQEWFLNRSPKEIELHTLILSYQYEYFEDMICEENSLCWDIASFVVNEIDYLYLDLDSNRYRFFIADDNLSCLGRCNGNEKAIEITQQHTNDKSVILHEMIHAYEFILESKLPVIRDILLLRLYLKLKPIINDLDKRISEHAELYGQSRVTASGGKHDLVFFLKSLDLDIRCDYPLGTVCGYGRDTGEMFY